MRKIAASYIMPVSSPFLKNGIVIVDDDGQIIELIDTGGKLRESSRLEFYHGIITPGFVIPCCRPSSQAKIISGSAFREFDRMLVQQGIKAIGVIEQEAGFFAEKRESAITYHTILELCPRSDLEEFEVYQQGIDLISEGWNEFKQSCSLGCCTSSLMETEIGAYILQYAAKHHTVLPLEDSTRWPLADQMARLRQQLVRMSEEIPANIRSNAHLVLIKDPAIALSGEDPDPAGDWTAFPAIRMKQRPNILEAMLDWQESSPGQTLREIIQAYTLHGARAIFEDGSLGSLEPGKRPGLNLLSNIEPGTFKLTERSTLKILV